MPQLTLPDVRFHASAVREGVAGACGIRGLRGHAACRHGTAALPVCRQLGIDRVLVTCDATNTASRKVIEANGGEFEVRRGVKLRYWIRTGN